MKIKLEKRDNLYYADLLNLPGSPLVGRGPTKHDAIAHLFYLTFHSDKQIHLNHDGLEIIEDEPKQPLYARLHLSLDCVMELRLTGEVTQEAFDRLLQYMKVTGEVWGLHSEQ